MLQHILIVEDDQLLAKTLRTALLTSKTSVTVASTMAQAFELLERQNFELIIVDRVLPDGEGLEVVEYIDDTFYHSRVLCLSEKRAIDDRVYGLQKGADDYLSKPFSLTELLLRINKLLQREKKLAQECLVVNKVILFPETGVVRFDESERVLRKRETQILASLFRHKNAVVTRDMLIDMVWGATDVMPTHITLDVYIRRLRVQLSSYHWIIKTIRGFGYSAVDHR